MQHFSKFTKQHVKLIPTNNAVQKFFHIQIISGIHSICAKQERCEIKCKSHRAKTQLSFSIKQSCAIYADYHVDNT